MTINTSIDPSDVYPADDYAHALLVDRPERLLFVAGTMGLDPAGAPDADLEAQLELVWANIERILTEAGLGLEHVVRVTSYLRDAGDAEANAAARLRALGGRRVPTTAIVVETLDPTWLVELEVVAVA
jgi:enamine deaminase RidA (YjgF/YER057c/UK114 family)